MYVGQIVHLWWRGKCTAAMIVDFWEEQTLASLAVFERGGLTQHSRVVKGEYRQDITWHLLSDCPEVGPELGHTSITPQAEDEDTNGDRDEGSREDEVGSGAGSGSVRERTQAANRKAVHVSGTG